MAKAVMGRTELPGLGLRASNSGDLKAIMLHFEVGDARGANNVLSTRAGRIVNVPCSLRLPPCHLHIYERPLAHNSEFLWSETQLMDEHIARWSPRAMKIPLALAYSV